MDYKRIVRESITGAVKHQDVTENEVDAAGKHVENVLVEESTSSSKLAENAEPAISKDKEYKTTDAGQDVGVPKDAKAFKDKKEFVSEDADALKDCSDKAECKIDFKKVMKECAESNAKKTKRMGEARYSYLLYYDHKDGMPDEATDNRKEADAWFEEAVDSGYDYVGLFRKGNGFETVKEYNSKDGETEESYLSSLEESRKKSSHRCSLRKLREFEDLPEYGVHYDHYEDGMPDEATDSRKEAEEWFKDAIDEGYDYVVLLKLDHGSYEVVKEYDSETGEIEEF